MTTPPANLLQTFAGRPAGLGRAYAAKTAAGTDCLALVSKASKAEGVDPKKMCATFVVTSDDPDRVDDVVVSKGLVLTHFKTNPVGLYGHGQMVLPIGKWEDPKGSLSVWPRGERTTGTLYFSQKTEHAAQVFALVEEGILRACSVGFNPLEDPVPRGKGFRFEKTDLLEISVVAIPAQPTATMVRSVLSRDRLAGAKILAPIRKSLEPLCEPAPAWSNGATLPEEGDVSKKWRKAAPKATKSPMASGSGTAGGYAVPPGPTREEDDKAAPKECVCPPAGGATDEKTVARLEALTDKVLAATAAVRKQTPPPPPHTQDGGGELPDLQQSGESLPEPGTGRADPKEVLSRLVDALTDYIDLTTKPAPTQAAPEMAGAEAGDGDGDGDEDDGDGYGVDGEGDMDLDGSQEEDEEDEDQGLDRYQFRAAAPDRAKAMPCKACLAKMCRACKEVMAGDGTEDDAADAAAPADQDGTDLADAPVTKKGVAVAEDLDEAAILAALAPVKTRVAAVNNTWRSLQGAMP